MIGVRRLYAHLKNLKSKTDRTTHPTVQRLSKRCMVCGTQVLKSTPPACTRHSTSKSEMVSWCRSVAHSGGKLSCGECDVDHGRYCVHGVLRSESCPYCPAGGRVPHEGAVCRRS